MTSSMAAELRNTVWRNSVYRAALTVQSGDEAARQVAMRFGHEIPGMEEGTRYTSPGG